MLKSLVPVLLLLVFACAARAQDELEHLSPFAHGAGRTYALSARGLDAVGLNPSLLALGTPKPFEITIAPISSLGIDAGSALKQINSIANGFQGNALSSTAISNTPDSITKGDSTRESLANLLGNNNLSSTLAIRVFGLSYFNPDIGGFALTWTMHGALEASIPNALLQYIGTNAVSHLSSGTPLLPQQLDVQAMWYSEYTLSYARTVYGVPSSGEMQLLAGAGLKYLTGIAMLQMDPGVFEINDFSNYPLLNPTAHYLVGVNYQIHSAYPDEFNFNSLPNSFSLNLIKNAAAGNGIGADLGFTLGAFDSTHHSPWEVAVSVSDIGSIHWNSNVSVRSADTVLNPNTSQGNKDTINNQLKALGGNLDSVGSFSTPLPTTLHIAGAIDFSEIGITMPGAALGAVAEYALGLTNTVGAPVHGRFGFAVTLEHPSTSFSLHTALGVTTQDGTTDLTFAIGFGIANSLLLDVGTDGLTSLFASSSRADAVFGLKILF